MPPTVVVAEDEAIVRLDLEELLAEEGFEVLAGTGRGDEALELIRRHRPDLAILDLKMPGADGCSVTREVATDGVTAVLVLTAFSQRELLDRARSAGALGYLVKPFRREELIAAIEAVLGRHEQRRALEAEVGAAPAGAVESPELLALRRNVDQAKARLMDERGIKDRDAFAFLQSQAAASSTTIGAVADQVISGTLRP